jgi:osmotically-inducible protein OsmY
VENGTLTLKGVVDSKADRDLAGILANGIPGAFAVNNELVIN